MLKIVSHHENPSYILFGIICGPSFLFIVDVGVVTIDNVTVSRHASVKSAAVKLRPVCKNE